MRGKEGLECSIIETPYRTKMGEVWEMAFGESRKSCRGVRSTSGDDGETPEVNKCGEIDVDMGREDIVIGVGVGVCIDGELI